MQVTSVAIRICYAPAAISRFLCPGRGDWAEKNMIVASTEIEFIKKE